MADPAPPPREGTASCYIALERMEWAQQQRRPVTVSAVMLRFNLSRASAYRLLPALENARTRFLTEVSREAARRAERRLELLQQRNAVSPE